ncbi:transporter [Mucilaginibacter terrae]
MFLNIIALTCAQAQDTSRTKWTVLKPIPRNLMREDMETDRPSITESPHTVDAGHFQYEADLYKNQRETSDDSRQRRWLVNQANFKLGISKNTEFQAILQSYGKEINRDLLTNEKQEASGFGDITLRLKQCLYNNYTGVFSIALMPYVKLPTNSFSDNKIYEEGLIVPMLVKLPHDWKIGLQVEGDYLKDDNTNARHAELLQSVVISHVFFKKLEVFGETYYSYNFKDHQIQNFFDAALEYEVYHDVKIDAGINYGLQKTAHKDFFLGIAFRY